jgi:hypothetical protein
MAITARKTTRKPARAAADDPLAPSRVRYLADVIGGAQFATVVGVNRSQPSRWMTGEERPRPTAAPLLIDLEHVIARAPGLGGGCGDNVVGQRQQLPRGRTTD